MGFGAVWFSGQGAEVRCPGLAFRAGPVGDGVVEVGGAGRPGRVGEDFVAVAQEYLAPDRVGDFVGVGGDVGVGPDHGGGPYPGVAQQVAQHGGGQWADAFDPGGAGSVQQGLFGDVDVDAGFG